ncbi:MAG: hypothetical protein ACRDNS_27075, partial [Trebonia sp.]
DCETTEIATARTLLGIQLWPLVEADPLPPHAPTTTASATAQQALDIARNFIHAHYVSPRLSVTAPRESEPGLGGRLDPSFAGRWFDAELLADLPPDVDPCGENGEFHTFVYAGPIFSTPITCQVGETVERDSFVFCDVLAADA